MKGRPPGTPKTDDPGKKKRRRTARQRDLCDVKIKITEYFPGADGDMAPPDFGAGVDAMDFMDNGREPAQPFGVLAPSATLPEGHPGAGGARYYTIQRVNGGANGKEIEGSGHKHTLDESDAIKKNSVKRKMLKEEKEKKRTDVSVLFCHELSCLLHPRHPSDIWSSCQNERLLHVSVSVLVFEPSWSALPRKSPRLFLKSSHHVF